VTGQRSRKDDKERHTATYTDAVY